MPQRKPKASELEYYGSEAKGKEGKRSIVAAHEGRIVGYLGSTMVRGHKQDIGRQVNLAWVDPDLQRRGIGSTMARLEAWRSGHKPLGDPVVSKKGAAFQNALGGSLPPEKGYGGREIRGRAQVARLFTPAMEREISETIQGTQGHMLHEQQFHPDVVKLAAPVKPPRGRRVPQGEQEQLFDPKAYPPGGLARPSSGTPRNARGQIQSKKRLTTIPPGGRV